MAQVYLARHRVTGGLFAIKVLADHLAQDESIVKRFIEEAPRPRCPGNRTSFPFSISASKAACTISSCVWRRRRAGPIAADPRAPFQACCALLIQGQFTVNETAGAANSAAASAG